MTHSRFRSFKCRRFFLIFQMTPPDVVCRVQLSLPGISPLTPNLEQLVFIVSECAVKMKTENFRRIRFVFLLFFYQTGIYLFEQEIGNVKQWTVVDSRFSLHSTFFLSLSNVLRVWRKIISSETHTRECRWQLTRLFSLSWRILFSLNLKMMRFSCVVFFCVNSHFHLCRLSAFFASERGSNRGREEVFTVKSEIKSLDWLRSFIEPISSSRQSTAVKLEKLRESSDSQKIYCHNFVFLPLSLLLMNSADKKSEWHSTTKRGDSIHSSRS